MKAFGRFFTLLAGCCLLIGFVLFGNLSIQYGDGRQDRWGVNVNLNFSLPKAEQANPQANWTDKFRLSLAHYVTHAFGDPSTRFKNGQNKPVINLNSVWRRFRTLVRIEGMHPNEISSHHAGIRDASREKNIDMNPSKTKKTN